MLLMTLTYVQLMTFKRILILGDCVHVALVAKCYFKLMNYNDVILLLHYYQCYTQFDTITPSQKVHRILTSLDFNLQISYIIPCQSQNQNHTTQSGG